MVIKLEVPFKRQTEEAPEGEKLLMLEAEVAKGRSPVEEVAIWGAFTGKFCRVLAGLIIKLHETD